jgi:uncharacterized protein (TIGR03118 family)
VLEITPLGSSAAAGSGGVEALEPRQFLSGGSVTAADMSMYWPPDPMTPPPPVTQPTGATPDPVTQPTGGTSTPVSQPHRRHRRGSAVYTQTNLVSDGATPAAVTDPNLVNPWGIAFNPQAFWWVADNETGVSTLYDSTGAIAPPGTPLVVNIPSPGDPTGGGAPTGIVFSGGNGFAVTNGTATGASRFLFATEDGTIAGWSPDVDATHAIIAVDNSAAGAIYKGIALATTKAGDELLAADFHNAKIDVFDANFAPVAPAKGAKNPFTDKKLPAGFAPFNVQVLGGKVYVAYAQQDAAGEDEVAGAGLGFVDIYNTKGKLTKRLNGGQNLNAPWGLAQAPKTFGRFGGDVLVGNFGDGRIMAFRKSGKFDGFLLGADNNPIVINGLWGLGFGNDQQAGPSTTLFFAAGTNDEANGLFGSLVPAATP